MGTKNFNKGKSFAVNDNKYRFPYFLSPSDDTTKGIDNLAAGYTNCAKNALCLFITIPEPEGKKNLKVNYKFKTTIRTAAAAEATLKPNDYTTSYARKLRTSLAAKTHLSRWNKWVASVSGTSLLMEPPSLVTMPSSLCTTVLAVVCVTSRLASASVSMVTPDTNARSAVYSDIKLSSFI